MCSLPLLNYIIDWILGQAPREYPEFRLEPMPMGHTSPMPTTLWSWLVATERCKACLQMLTATPPQSASALPPRTVRQYRRCVEPNPLTWWWVHDGCWQIEIPRLDIHRKNGQGTQQIRSRVNLAYSAFSLLQPCLGLWLWPVCVVTERALEVFDDDSICPSGELWRHLCSCKEGSAGVVMQQDVPTVNW